MDVATQKLQEAAAESQATRPNLVGLEAIFDWPGLSSTEKLVYFLLIRWMEGKMTPGLVIASAVMVAGAIGEGYKTGRRALNSLAEVGLIEERERLRKGRVMYVVHSPAEVQGLRLVGTGDRQHRFEWTQAGTDLSPT